MSAASPKSPSSNMDIFKGSWRGREPPFLRCFVPDEILPVVLARFWQSCCWGTPVSAALPARQGRHADTSSHAPVTSPAPTDAPARQCVADADEDAVPLLVSAATAAAAARARLDTVSRGWWLPALRLAPAPLSLCGLRLLTLLLPIQQQPER